MGGALGRGRRRGARGLTPGIAVPRGESVSDLAQGSSFTEKQISSYAQVDTSPLVLDDVVSALGLDVTAEARDSNARAAAVEVEGTPEPLEDTAAKR